LQPRLSGITSRRGVCDGGQPRREGSGLVSGFLAGRNPRAHRLDRRLWEIPRIVLAPADEQVSIACGMLRSIGLTAFSAADRQRFPILRGEPASPCPAARR